MFPKMWERCYLNVLKIFDQIILRNLNENLSKLVIQVGNPLFPFENCLSPSVYWGNE